MDKSQRRTGKMFAQQLRINSTALGVCLALALGCVGCAGSDVVSVKTPLQPGAVSRSQTFLVKDFAIENAVFAGDNADDASVVAQQKADIPGDLRRELVMALSRCGFKAHSYDEGVRVGDAVVIDGAVTHVNHGSGAARAWVGAGAGAAWMRAVVRIYKAETPADTLSEFTVEASSGGRGGLFASGDFTHSNVRDLADATAGFLDRNTR